MTNDILKGYKNATTPVITTRAAQEEDETTSSAGRGRRVHRRTAPESTRQSRQPVQTGFRQTPRNRPAQRTSAGQRQSTEPAPLRSTFSIPLHYSFRKGSAATHRR